MSDRLSVRVNEGAVIFIQQFITICPKVGNLINNKFPEEELVTKMQAPDRQSRQSNPMSPLRANGDKISRQGGGENDLASSYAASRVGSHKNADLVSQAQSRTSSKIQASAFAQQ